MRKASIFKRIGTFLVALAVVFTLIPAGVLPAAVSASSDPVDFGILHASYVEGIPMTDNNKLNEYPWRRKIALSDTLQICAAWEVTKLYLGFVGDAVTDLKVNGVAVDNVTLENHISLSDVNIVLNKQTVDREYMISFSAGGKSWTGKLVFDSFHYANTINSVSVLFGAENSANKLKFTLNNYDDANKLEDFAQIGYTGLAGAGNLQSSLDAPTVVELNVTVNQLPERTPEDIESQKYVGPYGGDWRRPYGCFAVTVSDEAKNYGMQTMFYRQNGNLYFAYWDNSADKYQSIVVGYYGAGKQYHLRYEFTYHAGDNGTLDDTDIVSAEYYVNGKLLAAAENVRAKKQTASSNTRQLYLAAVASTDNVEDTNTHTNVIVAYPSVSYTGAVTLGDCEHTNNTDDGDCTTALNCFACGKEITAAKAEHDWATEWTSDGTNHWHKCKAAGCTQINEKAACSGGVATCTENAKCEVCGEAYGEMNPDNHAKEAEWTITDDMHNKAYECCGKVVVAEEAHEEKDGKCQECGIAMQEETNGDAGDNNTAIVLIGSIAALIVLVAVVLLILNIRKKRSK